MNTEHQMRPRQASATQMKPAMLIAKYSQGGTCCGPMTAVVAISAR